MKHDKLDLTVLLCAPKSVKMMHKNVYKSKKIHIHLIISEIQSKSLNSPARPLYEVVERHQRPLQGQSQNVDNKDARDREHGKKQPPVQPHPNHGARDSGRQAASPRPALHSAPRNMRSKRMWTLCHSTGQLRVSTAGGFTHDRIWALLWASLNTATARGRQKERVGTRVKTQEGKLYLSASECQIIPF